MGSLVVEIARRPNFNSHKILIAMLEYDGWGKAERVIVHRTVYAGLQDLKRRKGRAKYASTVLAHVDMECIEETSNN